MLLTLHPCTCVSSDDRNWSAAIQSRRGVQLIVCMLVLLPLLAIAGLVIDLGHIHVVRGQMQRSADAAAMAATSELLHPDLLKPVPSPHAGISNARDKALWFASANCVDNKILSVDRNDLNDPNGEVVIGCIADPKDHSQDMSFFDPLKYNSVRVRVYRTAQRNGSVPLFLPAILGQESAEVRLSATATIQNRVRGFRVTSETGNLMMLPITIHVETWAEVFSSAAPDNLSWNEFTQTVLPASDGIKETETFLETIAPGNFGWLSIGSNDNGNEVLSRQVRTGVTAGDLAAYGGDLVLGSTGFVLDTTPGKRSSVIADLENIVGQTRVIPLHNKVTGSGSNAAMTIVAFVGVRIMKVDHRLVIQPAHVIEQTAIIGDGPQQSTFVYAPIQLSR